MMVKAIANFSCKIEVDEHKAGHSSIHNNMDITFNLSWERPFNPCENPRTWDRRKAMAKGVF